MWWRAVVAGILVAGVTELAGRYPRLGALLLTLPIVSIVAFVMTWTKSHDLDAINRLARETLILVPLGLPFFIPLAFSNRTGLTFWPSFGLGLLLATITISARVARPDALGRAWCSTAGGRTALRWLRPPVVGYSGCYRAGPFVSHRSGTGADSPAAWPSTSITDVT